MFPTRLRRIPAGLLAVVLMILPATTQAAKPEAPRFRLSNTSTPRTPPATIYRIALTEPDDHPYNLNDNIQVNIFTDRAGGGLENDIALQSQTIPQGDSRITLGQVQRLGLYFTRYKVGNEVFTNSFLILPIANQFTVQMVAAPTCTATVTPAQTGAVEKFFRNLTLPRMQSAATAVAPGWFAVNGQNFVVQVTKGIVLTYSGLGFIAILAENGIAQDIGALAIDFMATVLARVADDLQAASVLTAAERNVVKQVFALINGVAQTRLSATTFARVISIGQSVAEGLLGGDQDSQVLAKVVGDGAKRFEVLVSLVRP